MAAAAVVEFAVVEIAVTAAHISYPNRWLVAVSAPYEPIRLQSYLLIRPTMQTSMGNAFLCFSFELFTGHEKNVSEI